MQMGATHSTTNSRLRASVLAGIVLVIGVVGAIALRERPVDDPRLAHAMATNEAKPDAPVEAVGTSPTSAKDAVEQPRVHVAVGASEPPVAVAPSRIQHLVVRVIDGRGEPVAGAQVLSGAVMMKWLKVSAADGIARFDLVGFGGLSPFSCEVSVPGLAVSRAITKEDLDEPVEVVLDPIGSFEFSVLGPRVDVQVDVLSLHETQRRSEGRPTWVAADRVRVAVGCGREFRLVGTAGSDRRVIERSIGPTYAGQVVPVEFDFRRCNVRWRLPSRASGPLVLLCLTETWCVRCDVTVHAGDEASAEVPCRDRAWLVLVAGDEVWESEPMRLIGDVQLGSIALAPRPLHGVVEVRASDGSISRAEQYAESFVFPSGVRLANRMSTSTLVSTRFQGNGTEFRGLRLLDAIEVRPQLAGCYAEPRVVALRGGATERVQMSKGAQVELVGDGSRDASRSWWLESVATGERFAVTPAVLIGGAVRAHRFENLPPGDYRIVSDTVLLSPDRVTVPAGSEQRVRVATQPK